MIPPPLLGPTVWLPFAGSNFEVVLDLAGLAEAEIYNRKISFEIFITGSTIVSLSISFELK